MYVRMYAYTDTCMQAYMHTYVHMHGVPSVSFFDRVLTGPLYIYIYLHIYTYIYMYIEYTCFLEVCRFVRFQRSF